MKFRFKLLFVFVSLIAHAAFGQDTRAYEVTDNCATLIMTNPHNGNSTTIAKANLNVDDSGPYLQLRFGTGPASVIIAQWVDSNIMYLAPTRDSGKILLQKYTSYICTQCAGATQGPQGATGATGATGPTGAYGKSDTLPEAWGRFKPGVVAFLGVDSLSPDSATWHYNQHWVTVWGKFRMSYDSTAGGERTYKIGMQLPFASTYLNSLSGGVRDSFGSSGTVFMINFPGAPIGAYLRLTHQSGLPDVVSTYTYEYVYYTDSIVKGNVIVHEGPQGATGATGPMQTANIYTVDGTLTGDRTLETAGYSFTLADSTTGSFFYWSGTGSFLVQKQAVIQNATQNSYQVTDTFGHTRFSVDPGDSDIYITDYPNSRDDATLSLPANILYTSSSGQLLSTHFPKGSNDEFTPTASQTAFTLAHTPIGSVSMYVNGSLISKTVYSITGTAVTYSGVSLSVGVRVNFTYSY